MLSPSSLQIISGVLLLSGAVIAGTAGAPLIAIPIIASLFVLVEIARGKYTFKTAAGKNEFIKIILGFVFLFLIQCLIAYGLISLGGFLAKTFNGETLSFSWLVGLTMIALFAVLPFFVPALKRKQLMKSVFSSVIEEQEKSQLKLQLKRIESNVLGSLIQHPEFDDWWSSEAIYIPCLEKEVSVTFTDCKVNDAEAFIIEADKHLQAFMQMATAQLKQFTPELKTNLDMNIEATDYGEELPFMHLDNDEDIWSFITTDQIYVNKEDNKLLISVPYDCDWEQEHGFRLDFKNGVELIYAGQDY